MLSSRAKRLKRAAGRDEKRDGWLLSNGYLLVEQNNARLQKAIASCLRVRMRPFPEAASSRDGASTMCMNIDISGTVVLKVPDGLSHYMTTLGLAKEFVYSASWTEYWNA
jgi:hypothetical protein